MCIRDRPGPDAGASNNQQKPNDDGVVDADFKEVDVYKRQPLP